VLKPYSLRSELLTPVEGEQPVTVVPVETNDLDWTLPKANVSRKIFVNVSGFFFQQSYGKTWLTGRVVEKVQVEYNMSYYDRGSMLYGPPEEIKNATAGARLFVDEVFSQLHWTAQNITDHVIVMYAGGYSLHPHHHYRTVTCGRQSFHIEYSVVPENRSVATIAHEIAHGFGLDDLYNKDKNRDSDPVSGWGLMAHSGFDYRISDMCGYSRMRLGWIEDDQFVHVQSSSIHELHGINSRIAGNKLLVVRLDYWRYFLIESRIENEYEPGVLVTLLDGSRPTGGYGRLEVVRPFDAVELYSSYHALLKEGEQYIDPTYDIGIEVLTEDASSFQVEVTFGIDTSATQRSIGLPGNVKNVTATTLDNSTSLLAVTVANETSGVNNVLLYRYGDSLVLHQKSHHDYSCLNPVILTHENEYLLVYEQVNGTRHSIVMQSENTKYIASEDDDARHPSIHRSYRNLYLAYENHTRDGIDIVVRSKSASSWLDSAVPHPDSSCNVYPNANGTPHSPRLIDGNNDVSLAYLRSGQNNDSFEFRYDIEAEPALELKRQRISSFDIYSRTTYRFVISLSDSTENRSEIFHYNGYFDEIEKVQECKGIIVGVFGFLGIWHGYSSGSTFYLDRSWDGYKEQGIQIQLDLANATPLAITLSSDSGTPCMFLCSVSGSELELTRFYISTLSIRPWHVEALPGFQLIGIIAFWCTVVILIHVEAGKRVYDIISNQ